MVEQADTVLSFWFGVLGPDGRAEASVRARWFKKDEAFDREIVAGLPNVVWAGVVTGRYDIIAEVLISGGKNELYRFTTETILKHGEVVRSESFVIMKSAGNWVRPKFDK